MRYDLADAAVVVTGANGAARRLLEVLRFDAVIGTVESPAIAVAACRLQATTLRASGADATAYDGPKIRAAAAMISACGTSRTCVEMFQR
jgi:hypothetical protein